MHSRSNFHDGRAGMFKPYQVGVQLPCGVHPKVPEEGSLRQAQAASLRGVSPVGKAEGEPDRSRSLDERPPSLMIAIPPRYAVSQVVEHIKGRSTIHVARVCGEWSQNFVSQHFWARGFFVLTRGRDDTAIRDYIRRQEITAVAGAQPPSGRPPRPARQVYVRHPPSS